MPSLFILEYYAYFKVKQLQKNCGGIVKNY